MDTLYDHPTAPHHPLILPQVTDEVKKQRRTSRVAGVGGAAVERQATWLHLLRMKLR
jgi:hypothetical protein